MNAFENKRILIIGFVWPEPKSSAAGNRMMQLISFFKEKGAEIMFASTASETEFSEEVQALCYEAFFQTAWKKNWLAGVFFWKWYPQRHNREPDFTPQGKAAEQVMKGYFSAD